MLAGTGKPFDSAEHLFDAKWDGLRSIAFFGPEARLQARSLRNQTPQFPELERLSPGCRARACWTARSWCSRAAAPVSCGSWSGTG